jgi:hypothetical protein
VLGIFGLSVGRPGVEIVVADEDGRLHQLGEPITATAEQINAATAPTAAGVPIEDEDELYEAEDVEAALAEIAGAGRTTETVKGAMDAAGAAQDAAGAAQGTANDAAGAAAAAQAKADTAMQSTAGVDTIRIGTVTLGGANPTPVSFQDDTAASVTSGNAETYDLTGVGNGGTIILNPDGLGADTATVNFTLATSVSGATPSTDISGGVDTKFMISVDGDDAETVTLDLAAGGGINDGTKIAAEMQTKIQALGGNKASVAVDYNVTNAGKYTIKSATYGTGSSVVITRAADHNVTEELKIGTGDGGVETAGTGDVANAAAATADEIAAVINTDIAGVTADGSSGSVVITSDTEGSTSSIVMGNGTLNTVLGFTNAAGYYGAAGLGYDTDMANANYKVVATLKGVAAGSLANKALSVNNRATGGFDLVCQTAAATDEVDIIVIGQAAA